MTSFTIFLLCVAVAAVGYYTGSLDGYIDGHARGRKEGETTAARYLLPPANFHHQGTKPPSGENSGRDAVTPTPEWRATNPDGKSYIIFDPAVNDRLTLKIEKQFRNTKPTQP